MTKSTELFLQTCALVLIVGIITLQFFDGLRVPDVRSCAMMPTPYQTHAEAIQIHYSEPMAKRATELALRIEPHLPGMFSWQGNTLLFTPETGLQSGISYEITHDYLQAMTGKQNTAPSACRVSISQEQLLAIGNSQETGGRLVRFDLQSQTEVTLTPDTIFVTDYFWQRTTGQLWFLAVKNEERNNELPLVEQQQLYRLDLSTNQMSNISFETKGIIFSLTGSTYLDGVFVYRASVNEAGNMRDPRLIHIDSSGTILPFWYDEFANDNFLITPNGEGVIGKHYLTGEFLFVPMTGTPEDIQTIVTADHTSYWHPIWNTALLARTWEGLTEVWNWEAGASALRLWTQEATIKFISWGDAEEHRIFVQKLPIGVEQVVLSQGDRPREIVYETAVGNSIEELVVLPDGRTLYLVEMYSTEMQIIRIDIATGRQYTLPISAHHITWW